MVESGGITSATTIASGGRLDLAAGGALRNSVSFGAPGGTLLMDGTTLAADTVSGLAPGDATDLADVAFLSPASDWLGQRPSGPRRRYALQPRPRSQSRRLRRHFSAFDGCWPRRSDRRQRAVPLAFSLGNYLPPPVANET